MGLRSSACVALKHAHALRSCSGWEQQPAVLVYIPYARCACSPCAHVTAAFRTYEVPKMKPETCRNVFHFLIHGVAGVLQTLTEASILPVAIARYTPLFHLHFHIANVLNMVIESETMTEWRSPQMHSVTAIILPAMPATADDL